MPDREKVKAELDEIVEQCRGMDYIGFSTITEHCQNILALLKEQEAKNVVNMMLSKDWFRTASCPKCNELLKWVYHRNHCGYCGQAVKWE